MVDGYKYAITVESICTLTLNYRETSSRCGRVTPSTHQPMLALFVMSDSGVPLNDLIVPAWSGFISPESSLRASMPSDLYLLSIYKKASVGQFAVNHLITMMCLKQIAGSPALLLLSENQQMPQECLLR